MRGNLVRRLGKAGQIAQLVKASDMICTSAGVKRPQSLMRRIGCAGRAWP
jgi:hypothetical protein